MTKDKKILFSLVVIIIIGIIAGGIMIWLIRQPQQAPTEATEAQNNQPLSDDIQQEQSSEAEFTGEVKEFTMTAKQWEFSPSTITANEGDKVILKITSLDVPHGFFLPPYNINERLEPNQEVTIEFIATEKGVHSFFCSVYCGRGHQNMRGTLIVR